MTARESAQGAALDVVQKIQALGLDGMGPLKGAQQIAEEHLAQHLDPEVAIRRLIRTHVRLVAATGFATGVGGAVTLPVTIPTDIAVFYALAARCAGAVAVIRGWDLESDEVRSVVLLTLLGSAGVGIAADVGVTLGTKAAMATLAKLPGRVLIAINKKVGFRLITKFGQKGVVNIWKWIPLVGGAVGGSVNAAGMQGIGAYARSNFPKN